MMMSVVLTPGVRVVVVMVSYAGVMTTGRVVTCAVVSYVRVMLFVILQTVREEEVAGIPGLIS